jgi:hypothetical protein
MFIYLIMLKINIVKITLYVANCLEKFRKSGPENLVSALGATGLTLGA